MTKFETRTARKTQSGFTLLEMLVTVGIMAAVAGTATVALQDTTARASAAAHVAMMDELNEGIMTYRALPNNNNSYPNNFDSLIAVDDATMANPEGSEALGIATADGATVNDIGLFALPAGFADPISASGISELRYIGKDLDADGAASPFTCDDTNEIIASRANAVVPGNIFMSPAANGCGFSRTLVDGDTVMVWTGGNERVLGAAAVEPGYTAAAGVVSVTPAAGNIGAKVLMAVGAGPASNLFDASELGGLTSVPVYRHVANTQYNRFIVLFEIGEVTNVTVGGVATPTLVPADQVVIAGVVDGAGDTKEEELGEWDGTRNTI